MAFLGKTFDHLLHLGANEVKQAIIRFVQNNPHS